MFFIQIFLYKYNYFLYKYNYIYCVTLHKAENNERKKEGREEDKLREDKQN